jgi:hypothetical protein
MKTHSHQRYLAVLFIAFAVAWPSFAMVQAIHNVSFCSLNGYDARTNYVAFCGDLHYGDFEHQVFYDGSFDTSQRLRESDVLFIGNSQIQAAFSRSNVAPFFEQRSARFFMAGFGYVEGWRFPAAVMRRHRAGPKILVLNVSYWIDWTSEPARYTVDHPISGPIGAFFKGLAPSVYAWLCATCGGSPSLLRSKGTGQWDWRNFDPVKLDGDPVEATRLASDEEIQAWADHVLPWAKELIASTSARCVILTQVPSPGPQEVYAQKLAQYVDAHVILPKVEGLRTWDGSHLTAASSVAWSGAFLRELDALGPRCGAW